MNPDPSLIALAIIRDTLGLPSTASLSDIVAKVREMKTNRPASLRSRRVFRAQMDLTKHEG